MSLTPAQLVTLKADMLGASSVALATFIANNDTANIAAFYNAPHATLKVWREDAPTDAVRGAVLWNRFTPADSVPTDTALNVAIWQARSDACQGKQFNLQLMLGTSETLPGHLQGFRDGIKDLCLNIPSGANGATQNGGWASAGNPVQVAMLRPITIFENLFATTVDSANNRTTTVFDVTLTQNDAADALVA